MKADIPWLLGIGATLLLPCAGFSQEAVFDTTKVFRTVGRSVVLIRIYDDGGRLTKVGSGFFIEDGSKIVSNYHVIAGASRIEVVEPNGSLQRVTQVYGYSEASDLAILVAPATRNPLSVVDARAEVGERVIAIGNPMGLQGSLSEGLISGIREINGSVVYQMTAPISPGSSGGPVINALGQVIGVASFTLAEGQNLNFAITSASITRLLKTPQNISVSDLVPLKAQNWVRGSGVELIRTQRREQWPGRQTVSMSLKNSTSYQIKLVLIRLVYFALPEENSIPETVEEKVSRIEADLKQAQENESWWRELLKKGVNVAAQEQALAAVAKRKVQLLEELGETRKILADQLKKGIPPPEKPKRIPMMVHYQDQVLKGPIAPKMVKFFEFDTEMKPEWSYEIRVLDHLIEKDAAALIDSEIKRELQ